MQTRAVSTVGKHVIVFHNHRGDRDYTDGWDAQASLAAYFRCYNHERIHQSLGYRTPLKVYRDRGSSGGPTPDENGLKSRDRLIAG